MRIHVTGNAGAGKTMLARALGKGLGLPVIHLGEPARESGSQHAPETKLDPALVRMTQRENWVIEGISGLVRQRADLVVFLDPPRRACMWRYATRGLRYLVGARPELPGSRPNWRIRPKLLRTIWRFPESMGAKIRSEALESSKYVVIEGRAQAETWRDQFISEHRPGPQEKSGPEVVAEDTA